LGARKAIGTNPEIAGQLAKKHPQHADVFQRMLTENIAAQDISNRDQLRAQLAANQQTRISKTISELQGDLNSANEALRGAVRVAKPGEVTDEMKLIQGEVASLNKQIKDLRTEEGKLGDVVSSIIKGRRREPAPAAVEPAVEDPQAAPQAAPKTADTRFIPAPDGKTSLDRA